MRFANNGRRNYANALARPALRRTNVSETTGLHLDCFADAGHWRKQRHFQRRQRHSAVPAGLQNPEKLVLINHNYTKINLKASVSAFGYAHYRDYAKSFESVAALPKHKHKTEVTSI
jgi:hypothetical protein